MSRRKKNRYFLILNFTAAEGNRLTNQFAIMQPTTPGSQTPASVPTGPSSHITATGPGN